MHITDGSGSSSLGLERPLQHWLPSFAADRQPPLMSQRRHGLVAMESGTEEFWDIQCPVQVFISVQPQLIVSPFGRSYTAFILDLQAIGELEELYMQARWWVQHPQPCKHSTRSQVSSYLEAISWLRRRRRTLERGERCHQPGVIRGSFMLAGPW